MTYGPAIVYHGTPLTPRAALLDVGAGRALCVSFFRPDDVEAVEAISPAVMFRLWRIFRVAGSAAQRRRLVYSRRLDAIFQVARAAHISSVALGSNSRRAGCAVTAQRFTVAALAVRGSWRAALAHGPTDRPAVEALRKISARLPWVDRRREASGSPGLSSADGRNRPRAWKPLADSAHDARHCGRGHVSIFQRRRNVARTERASL